MLCLSTYTFLFVSLNKQPLVLVYRAAFYSNGLIVSDKQLVLIFMTVYIMKVDYYTLVMITLPECVL